MEAHTSRDLDTESDAASSDDLLEHDENPQLNYILEYVRHCAPIPCTRLLIARPGDE